MTITSEDLKEFAERFDHADCYGGKTWLSPEKGLSLLAHIDAQAAEITRLTAALKVANEHTEKFERESYLMSDKAEAAETLNNHLDLAVRKAEGVSEALRRRAEDAEKELAALRQSRAPVAVPDFKEHETAFDAGVRALIDCLEDCGDADQGLRLAFRAYRVEVLRLNSGCGVVIISGLFGAASD